MRSGRLEIHKEPLDWKGGIDPAPHTNPSDTHMTTDFDTMNRPGNVGGLNPLRGLTHVTKDHVGTRRS